MWVRYALYAMLSFTCMQLLFKQLTVLGLDPAKILAWLFGTTTLFYAGHMLVTRQPAPLRPGVLGLIVLASIFSYLGNLFMLRSVEAAPNPGYSGAIGATQVVLVVFASTVLFQSELSPLKVCGALLCLGGVMLISMG